MDLLARWGEFFVGIIDPRGFYGHLGVGWAFMVFAWRRIKAGAWVPPIRSVKGIFSPHVNLLHYAAQGGLLVLGMVQWGGSFNWLYGAAAALPAGMTLAFVMLLLGFFDRPRFVMQTVGDINPPPPGKRPSQQQPPNNDKDRGDTW